VIERAGGVHTFRCFQEGIFSITSPAELALRLPKALYESLESFAADVVVQPDFTRQCPRPGSNLSSGFLWHWVQYTSW
jgi:cytosine/uracil/thiamine/allantoin permease